MQFSELGAPDKQAIVMLPPMMCSNAVHLPVAQLLAQDFRVVLPTYDGHCLDGSRYTSKLDQCAKIRSYLDDQGIEDVALVQGSSMGAEIALELLHERPQIRNGFFDGGPFFHFPGFVRHRFDKVFMKIVDTARGFQARRLPSGGLPPRISSARSSQPRTRRPKVSTSTKSSGRSSKISSPSRGAWTGIPSSALVKPATRATCPRWVEAFSGG